MPDCKNCNGTGMMGPVHVYYGPGKGSKWKKIPCYYCDGAGALSDERFAAYEIGQKAREERRAAGLTLNEAARQRGTTPAAISRMERGLDPEEGA